MNTLSRAATTAGAAASHRDQQKRTAYARVEPHGYGFVPFSVETCGCLGQPAMKLLRLLGVEAADPGDVTRASFVNVALQELMWVFVGRISCHIEHLLACWLGPVAPASVLACACLQMNVWSSVAWCLLVMFCLPVLVLSMSNF
jgi:hypothetical protein